MGLLLRVANAAADVATSAAGPSKGSCCRAGKVSERLTKEPKHQKLLGELAATAISGTDPRVALVALP